MTQPVITPIPAEALPPNPDYVYVYFHPEIGPARVLVPAGATVEYETVYWETCKCFALLVFVDDGPVGFHCGERSDTVITFARASDADRLCQVRNAAWAARCSG